MKHMNMVKKFGTINLQIFADDNGQDGDDAGDDDSDQDDGDDDSDDDEQDEKRFTQKDIDEAVKKRLARERKKWKRENDKSNTDGQDKPDGDGKPKDDTKLKEAESRASKAEVKVACYEAGVAKDSVDDVAALAHAYMDADEDLDLEDAIEKVVKKYPHFKKNAGETDDEPGEKKAWGERQNGRSNKKMSGVERRFYELNPDLKK